MLAGSAWSRSSMWAANAATVTPSADSGDGRLHLTPANLLSNLHRSLEPSHTAAALRRIFSDETRFAVHAPLPAQPHFSDEGRGQPRTPVFRTRGVRSKPVRARTRCL